MRRKILVGDFFLTKSSQHQSEMANNWKLLVYLLFEIVAISHIEQQK